jgi:hypothetical protein
MALLVFDIKGIPASRRERIAADVKAVETHLSESLEAWISWDSFGETARVLITGRLGLSGRSQGPTSRWRVGRNVILCRKPRPRTFASTSWNHLIVVLFTSIDPSVALCRLNPSKTTVSLGTCSQSGSLE